MSVNILRTIAGRTLGVALVVAAFNAPAWAIVPAGTPEIDPGLLPSALVLLAGGTLVLRARRRRG